MKLRAEPPESGCGNPHCQRPSQLEEFFCLSLIFVSFSYKAGESVTCPKVCCLIPGPLDHLSGERPWLLVMTGLCFIAIKQDSFDLENQPVCPVTCSQEPKKTQLGAPHTLQPVNTQATSKLHTHKAMTTPLHTSGRWIPVHPTSSASSWINPVSFSLETEYVRLSKVIKQERRGRV